MVLYLLTQITSKCYFIPVLFYYFIVFLNTYCFASCLCFLHLSLSLLVFYFFGLSPSSVFSFKLQVLSEPMPALLRPISEILRLN